METTIRACAAAAPRRAQLAATTLLAATCAQAQLPEAPGGEVRICTDLGAITIELDDARAPAAAANFRRYVEDGFFSGTVFHRVVPGRVVQGGGYDRALLRRPTREPVINESANGLSNERGTIAAARLEDPDSATAQFFINVDDNSELDGSEGAPGYTVFGRVSDGMDVVDTIAALPTGAQAPLESDVPKPLVALRTATLLGAAGDGLQSAPDPRQALESARANDDAASTLAVIDALYTDCTQPEPELLLAEAEAALALEQVTRARFALDNYFALSAPSEPSFDDAQSLYGRLPPNRQSGIGPLIAHCATPAAPDIPDGSRADLDTMLEAQAAMRAFMDSSDLFLGCLSEVVDRKGLNDAYEVAIVERHNEAIGVMEKRAAAFNAEVRAFKARQR